MRNAMSSPASLITRAAFDAAKRKAVEQRWSNRLPVEEFLQQGGVLGTPSKSIPILDVRAPCEYAKGHVPGAISVPLFDDDERAEVGTLYKRNGHDSAVRRGLQIVERKGWEELLSNVPALCEGDGACLPRCCPLLPAAHCLRLTAPRTCGGLIAPPASPTFTVLSCAQTCSSTAFAAACAPAGWRTS